MTVYNVNQEVLSNTAVTATVPAGGVRNQLVVRLAPVNIFNYRFYETSGATYWQKAPYSVPIRIQYRFGTDSWKTFFEGLYNSSVDTPPREFIIDLTSAEKTDTRELQVRVLKREADIEIITGPKQKQKANRFKFLNLEAQSFLELEELLTSSDVLISEDTAEFVLGICEGEIEGLEDGEKSFYLGDTALVSQGGTKNFQDFNIETTLGKPSGEEITLALTKISRSYTINTTLLSAVPVVRATQPSRRNYLDLRLAVQSLSDASAGSVQGDTVEFQIRYRKSGQSNWVNIQNAVTSTLRISGRTTSTYIREYQWAVDPDFFGVYEVEVTKVTVDRPNESEPLKTNTLVWESLQEVGSSKLNLPNTALTRAWVKASGQFNSLPDPSGVYKLRKIKVPVNYDPVARTYSGVWDGTFKIAWSNNPAWAVYDLIDNDRFGINAHYPVTANKWDFYEAAVWCDEKVSDGNGGLQPRYSLNLYVADIRDGKELVEYMAGSFNARLVEYPNGDLGIRVDKDDDAVMLFTPDNITNEGFSYTYADPATRYNDITVSHTDPELAWDNNQYRVFDQEDIDLNGRVPYDFVAVGTLNRHEALRKAYYKLITSLTETETVTFKTNRLAQCLQAYDVILVADPTMGYGLNARITELNATRDEVTVRKPLYLEVGVTYEATFEYKGDLITREVTTTSTGNTYTINLNEPLPEDIFENASFTLGSLGQSGAPKPYRVLNIEEAEGNPDKYVVTAVEINRLKWAAVDNLEMASTVQYSRLPSQWVVPPPENVTFLHNFIRDEGRFETTMNVTLNKQSYPWYSGEYEIWGRKGQAGGWQLIDNIRWLEQGEWQIKVLPFNWFGQKTNFELASTWNASVPAPSGPENVVGFVVNVIDENTGVFAWGRLIDPHVTGYQLRYSPDIDEDKWGNMTILGTVAGTTIMLPPRTGAYAVKAVNRWGLFSEEPTFIRTDLENILQLNVVIEEDDAPTWEGTKEQVVLVEGALELDSVDVMEDWVSLEDVLNFRVGENGVYTDGTYYLSETVDLGQISVCKILSTVEASGIHLANYMSTWGALSEVENLAGTSLSDWAVTSEFRFSNNGVDWSSWRQLTYSKIGARYFQFRLRMFSNDSFITPRVTSWKIEIDVEERYLGENDVLVPVEGKTVLFEPAFIGLKGLGIAAQGLQSGDYYEINNKDNYGFDIIFKDSGDNPVQRTFDYVAVGYGRIIEE